MIRFIAQFLVLMSSISHSKAAYTTDFIAHTRTPNCDASAYVTSQYTELATLTTQTTGQCVLRCDRNPLCGSFLYDVTTKVCTLLDKDYLRTVCDDSIVTWSQVLHYYVISILT